MSRRAVDRTRRALLKGRPGETGPGPLRPPWARADFEDACTRCGACLAACPESILVAGDGGFPEVDFRHGSGECTFCAACREACPEPAFRAADAAPWGHVARIGEACFAARGIHCQSCAEACGWQAIRFTPVRGGPPVPRLDAAACTGCGACLAACPAEAIAMSGAVEPAHG